MRRLTTGLMVACVCAGATGGTTMVVAAQQQQQQQEGSKVVLAPRVGVAGSAPLSLSLDDVVRMTLEQNNDVSIARLDADIAKQDVYAAEGVFDPRLAPISDVRAHRLRQYVSGRRGHAGPPRTGSVRRIGWAGWTHALGRRTVHRRFLVVSPGNQQPVRPTEPAVPIGAERHATFSRWHAAGRSTPNGARFSSRARPWI